MKIIKDAIILCIITVVAGFGLGAVYDITKAPIEKVNYETQQNAYKTVFADASEFTDLPDFSSEEATKIVAESGYSDTIEGCVQAKGSDGSVLGYVITVVSHDGYGGDIKFSVGIKADGTVNGYSITDINETAGLGMKAKEEAFYAQFENKQVEQFAVTKTGSTSDSEIDAISGATITSSAVTNGVNASIVYFKSLAE